MESDYTLLYLHHGLTSDNKPSFSWLRDAYREFDRKWVGASGEAPGPRGASTSALCWAALCLGRSVYSMPWGRRVPPNLGRWNTKTPNLERPGLESQFLC